MRTLTQTHNYLARLFFIQVQTSQCEMKDSQTSTLNQLVRDRSSKEYAYASLPAPELSTHHISGCLESRYSFIAVVPARALTFPFIHAFVRTWGSTCEGLSKMFL